LPITPPANTDSGFSTGRRFAVSIVVDTDLNLKMPTVASIGFVALGVLLIGCSRVIADSFKVPGNTHPATRFMGLGDNYASRLYRWTTAVLVGLVLAVVGIAELFGA
jgi:hypothetical protein